MRSIKKYNVLIIGAGNIGAFFDTPASKNVFTHAHAFAKHKGFHLLGFFDVDRGKARKAASVWHTKAFSNIDDVFKKNQVDIACVAVPDHQHLAVIKKLSAFPLKFIFVEKPLARTIGEAKKIMEIIRGKDIKAAVNYTRRFVPDFGTIKNNIRDGVYGKYLTGTGYYGKGLFHNGSHLIDLLRYFFGEILEAKHVNSVSDFHPDDKSISAVLTFKNEKPFFLQCVDSRKYTLFELDLLFEKKRIRIKESGFKIEEYDVRENKVFKGYRNIVKTFEKNTSLPKALYYAVENIYKHLTTGNRVKCSAEEAYKTLQCCMKLKETLK